MIIKSVSSPQEVQDTESDEEEMPKTHISWAEASEALNTFMKFAERSQLLKL